MSASASALDAPVQGGEPGKGKGKGVENAVPGTLLRRSFVVVNQAHSSTRPPLSSPRKHQAGLRELRNLKEGVIR